MEDFTISYLFLDGLRRSRCQRAAVRSFLLGMTSEARFKSNPRRLSVSFRAARAVAGAVPREV